MYTLKIHYSFVQLYVSTMVLQIQNVILRSRPSSLNVDGKGWVEHSPLWSCHKVCIVDEELLEEGKEKMSEEKR